MSAISITAASVVKGAGASTAKGVAGETITAGMPVYESGGQYFKADANLSDAAAQVVGIALHAALAGQPLHIITGGRLTLNAVLIAGKWYVAGAAVAGDIAPIADLASGWRSTLLGYAISTTVLFVVLIPTGVTN